MIRVRSFHLRTTLWAVAAMLCLGGLGAPARAQFETRSTLFIPGEATAIAAGDFNHDGQLDIAFVTGQLGLGIALGNGDGTFQKPALYYPLTLGGAIALGDFNGDGNLDVVATAYPYSNEIEVFLGNGDGTFQAPKASGGTNEYPTFVIAGDFNGDHKLDVAIIDTPYVSVLLGNGDGTFRPPSDNESFVGPQYLAVGDFNNDHKLDVAAVGFFGGSSGIGVLLGNGDGTLQSSLTDPLAFTPATVAVGDFNQDGNLDAAVTGIAGGVYVLIGNGDGSLQPPGGPYSGGDQVVVSDFNGDGSLDLATPDGPPLGLSVLYGKGDGTFEPAQLFPTGENGLPVAGDFNDDHKPDVAFLNGTAGVITVLNTGAAGFSPTSPLVFANQLLNTVSPSQTVTLTNTGGKALSLTSIKWSGQFGVTTTCGKSLKAEAQCLIVASFAPKTQGSHKGLVTVVDSASSKPEVIELSGAGTVVELSPSSLEFAAQKVGTTSPPQDLQLTNTGKTPLAITNWTLHGLDPNDFAQTNNCPSPLNAGSGCTIAVTFTPTRTGNRSAILYITDTGGGSPQTLPLSGIGK